MKKYRLKETKQTIVLIVEKYFDNLIRKYGFEHKKTVKAAKIVENLERGV